MSDDKPSDAPPAPADEGGPLITGVLRSWLGGLGGGRNGGDLDRETLTALIENPEETDVPLAPEERRLLANVLLLRDMAVEDVMVPRADIVGVEINTSLKGVMAVIVNKGHSRVPVYRGNLDDAVGMVHVKDVLPWIDSPEGFSLAEVQRDVLFVSPSMPVLELLLEMRVKRCHMALVVDEFGGIDGLATIEDLVEEIVGEIQDEHDRDQPPKLTRDADGIYEADARVYLETFEEEAGVLFDDEERAEIDTLGGLVFSLAGHVPIRGELVAHPSGLEFEVLEADPRRIKKLRIRRRADTRPVA